MNDREDSRHVRNHRSFLANGEKKLLVWLARRLPRRINSDHLTLIGLFSTLLAGLSFWASRWEERMLLVVVAALFLNWLGDSLDGTVARVRNQQRPRYGFYVDHVIDILGALFMLGGLAVSGYMNPIIALGLLVGFLLAASESFLATHARGVFTLSFMGFGPTEMRILLAAGTLYVMYQPMVRLGSLGPFRLFDVGGAIGAASLFIAMVVSAIRNTRALYLSEPIAR